MANATAERPAQLPAAQQPPENSVWIRYHPWIEGIMAHISAWSIHLLVIGGAVVWFTYLAYAFGYARPQRSLPVEPVQLASRGGDGQSGGADAGEIGDKAPLQEDVAKNKNSADENLGSLSTSGRPELNPVQPKKSDPAFSNPDDRVIKQGNEAMDPFVNLEERLKGLHNRMSDGAKPNKGNGGPGSVGSDVGTGPATGPNTGDGAVGKPVTDQDKRMARWSMRFNTQDSADYLRQLRGLGAVLAIPDGPNSCKVVDLTKMPFKAENKDIFTIKKIWWFDNNPRSVQGLMAAMGLPFRPERDVAFIPKEVEEEIAKKEKETGIMEDDIFETTFGVKVPGVGGRKYDVWVIGQKTKEEVNRAKQ